MTSKIIPEKMAIARFAAIEKFPYFSSLIWALSPVPTEDLPFGAVMGVDEWWRLYYSPSRVEASPVNELITTFIHEIGHLMRFHADRARAIGAQYPAWNFAGDAEINDDLKAWGLKMKEGLVMPATLGQPEGRLAEEYYNSLPTMEVFCNCGSGADGEKRGWELPPPEGGSQGVSKEEAKLIVADTARQINDHAKSRGTVPGSLQRWAGTILSPTVRWQKVLPSLIRRSFADAQGMVDYSFKRPRQKRFGEGSLVLPRLRKPALYPAVVIDTSGSMGDAEESACVAEAGGIIKAVCDGMGVSNIPVLAVDAAVHVVKKIYRPEQIKLAGGGGTDMRIGIEAALELKPRPQVIIVLTDGYTPWPEHAPRNARVVIGLINAGDKPPATPAWAKTVIIK